MIKARLKFLRGEVENFSLKDPVQIKIFFNDGKDRMLSFRVPLQNTEVEAHNIISAIRKFVKDANQDDVGGDSFLDSIVTVAMDDEEMIEERMRNFLEKIVDKRHHLGGTRMHGGYLDSLNMAKSIKVNFEGSGRDADTGRSLRRL